MARIHPTALVDPAAELADDVEVGPYAIVGPQVRVGSGTSIGAHTVISGRTTIGRSNRIFPHAAIGGAPQDKKYAGEDTELTIGDGNTIREFCTFNIGTAQGGGVTRVGSDNWVMAYAHVAHDCCVGDHCILANAVTLAGHVELGDWVILGGLTAVHQFCKVGPHAMTAGGSIVLHDIPPYVMAAGNSAQAFGINSEGLRRRGFSAEAISAVRRAYKVLYKSGLTLEQARTELDALTAGLDEGRAEVEVLTAFLRAVTRGIVR